MLLSVVALMFLLLPMLLLTTSVSKLVGLDLALAQGAGELPPPPPGAVEAVTVVVDEHLEVTASVRRTDVVTSAGDVEVRSWELARGDARGLQGVLRDLKELDPLARRVVLAPDDAVSAAELVRLMDVVRSDSHGALFDEVVLGVPE